MKCITPLALTILIISCNQVQELATVNCHMQSPVNIIPGEEVGTRHEVMVHYKTSKERVANLGHTVEVEYDSGSYITYDGLDYQFKQFHFHTPSEHMVAGNSYDMEMHIVHTNQREGVETPDYLVIGVLFMQGDESPFLNTFLDAIPEQEGEVFESSKKTVNAAEMIPEKLGDFFNYRGSLTTPPYSETVNWIVLRDPKTASQAQINVMKAIEGNNARRVQFLYDRVIESVN